MNRLSRPSGRRTAGHVTHGRRLAGTGILLAFALLTIGVASAWAGSGVSLCLPKKEGGSVRTPKHGVCGKGYKLTALNTEATEGKFGAEGKAGAPGSAGAAGKEGPSGPEGKHGADGAPGKEGVAGPEGKTALSASELETLHAILPHIKYLAAGVGGKATVQFSGVNVQVISGAGKTSAAVNGLGNVVIGYDENPKAHAQTGSHNLILGEEQSFTSYGGIAAGFGNAIGGPFASVTGGGENSATGKEASISGGWRDVASAENASVSGGRENVANNLYSWVGGGKLNTASAAVSSIFGSKSLTTLAEFEAIP